MKKSQDPLKQLGMSSIQTTKGVAEYRLNANGLKILLVENHSAPVVTTMVLYRVGSRDEAVGHTGATHFLEHMMFKGTRKHHSDKGTGVDDLLKPVGAVYNATTWYDRTNYFEAVPSQHLELTLAIEADRMRNLVLKGEDRDSEMTVVRNEFERGENDPDDVMLKEMYAMSFREHPYHHPTIGWRSDVEGVPLERLKAFYDTFYWPNNSTVVVVGDFEPIAALKLIAKHFGKIPRSPHPIPEVYTVEPPQEGERRFEVSRAGDLPRVMVAFHIPESTHPDNYALAAAGAILGGVRRSSRLYKRLVDTQLASEIFTWHNEQHDPGLFLIGATVAPGAKAEDVEAAIADELLKLAAEPVTDEELKRAKSANRKSTILTAADPLGLARQLGEAEAVADWTWYAQYDDKFDAVTPEDVQRVAGAYFTRRNRTTGYFIPKEEEPDGTSFEQGTAPIASTSPKPSRATCKDKKAQRKPAARRKAVSGKAAVAQEPTKATFASQVIRTVLPNGLTLLVMPNRGTGSVAISGKLRAGGYFCPDKSMVPKLACHMLTKGSANYSKAAIAETLEEMGTSLTFSSDNFTVNFNTTVVKDDLPGFLTLLSDVMRNPLFETEELGRSSMQFAAFIQQQMKDTAAVCRNKLLQSLYGPDCVYYDKPFEAVLTELAGISADDLKTFHREHYSAAGTILSVVGDIDPSDALKLIESRFADWSSTQGLHVKQVAIAPVAAPQAASRIEVALADKANVDIAIGLPASLKRTDPDFFAARLANAALGQDTLSSRLGVVVREKHGLTYGINSAFEDTSFGGAPWTVRLSVNPANIEQALTLVREVVSEYCKKGISTAELADEAGRAAGNFQVMLRTSAGIAQVLTTYEFAGLGVETMDTYADALKAVTRKQVNEAIGKYFRLDNAVTVLAGTFLK